MCQCVAAGECSAENRHTVTNTNERVSTYIGNVASDHISIGLHDQNELCVRSHCSQAAVLEDHTEAKRIHTFPDPRP